VVEVPEDVGDVPAFGSLLMVGAALFCVFGGDEELHLFEDVGVLLVGVSEAVEVEDEEEVVVDFFELAPLLGLLFLHTLSLSVNHQQERLLYIRNDRF
jgi:hypothetical protein